MQALREKVICILFEDRKRELVNPRGTLRFLVHELMSQGTDNPYLRIRLEYKRQTLRAPKEKGHHDIPKGENDRYRPQKIRKFNKPERLYGHQARMQTQTGFQQRPGGGRKRPDDRISVNVVNSNKGYT